MDDLEMDLLDYLIESVNSTYTSVYNGPSYVEGSFRINRCSTESIFAGGKKSFRALLVLESDRGSSTTHLLVSCIQYENKDVNVVISNPDGSSRMSFSTEEAKPFPAETFIFSDIDLTNIINAILKGFRNEG